MPLVTYSHKKRRKSGIWRSSPLDKIHNHHIMKIQLYKVCSRAPWKNVSQTSQSLHILTKLTLIFYVPLLMMTPHQHRCPSQKPATLCRFPPPFQEIWFKCPFYPINVYLNLFPFCTAITLVQAAAFTMRLLQ